jgi:hypothetical protein
MRFMPTSLTAPSVNGGGGNAIAIRLRFRNEEVTAQAGKSATNFTNCHEFLLYQFVLIRVIRGKNPRLPEAWLSSYH